MAETSRWKFVVMMRPRNARYMYEFVKENKDARLASFSGFYEAQEAAQNLAAENLEHEYAVAEIKAIYEGRPQAAPYIKTVVP